MKEENKPNKKKIKVKTALKIETKIIDSSGRNLVATNDIYQHQPNIKYETL